LNRKQNGEGLPDFFVEIEIVQFFDVDFIRFLQKRDFFRRDVAEDSHA